MIESIKQFSVHDYLAVLPATTRAAATDAEARGVDLILFAQQVAAEPATGLATKGGVFWPSNLIAQIGRELHALVCTDDPRYETWREKINNEGTTAAKVLVVLASNGVAATLGFAASLCVPFVALTLAAASKLGAEAWCQIVAQQIAASKAAQWVDGSNPPAAPGA